MQLYIGIYKHNDKLSRKNTIFCINKKINKI
jgi:hypothetical protein